MKELYRMTLHPSECGLSVWTDTYLSVHETPCYHYVIRDWDKQSTAKLFIKEGESVYQSLKRRGCTMRKVHKESSRFAFDTKEKAFKQLVFIKGRHLEHMVRDIQFLKSFLKFSENNGLSDLESSGGLLTVPDTRDLVFANLTFD